MDVSSGHRRYCKKNHIGPTGIRQQYRIKKLVMITFLFDVSDNDILYMINKKNKKTQFIPSVMSQRQLVLIG